jgi:hypothetical protein
LKNYEHAAIAYAASKILSDHAATDFMKQHSDGLSFDLVRVLPGYIQGYH